MTDEDRAHCLTVLVLELCENMTYGIIADMSREQKLRLLSALRGESPQ